MDLSVAEPESLISRAEVVATLFNIADIALEAKIIRAILEEDSEEEEDQLAERAQGELDARKRESGPQA